MDEDVLESQVAVTNTHLEILIVSSSTQLTNPLAFRNRFTVE
jgi:hypothetical protein